MLDGGVDFGDGFKVGARSWVSAIFLIQGEVNSKPDDSAVVFFGVAVAINVDGDWDDFVGSKHYLLQPCNVSRWCSPTMVRVKRAMIE